MECSLANGILLLYLSFNCNSYYIMITNLFAFSIVVCQWVVLCQNVNYQRISFLYPFTDGGLLSMVVLTASADWLYIFTRKAINNARSSLYCFLGAVQQYSSPSCVRTDDGGEFLHLRTFMRRQQGEGRRSAIAGQSVHNVRIERLWRDVYYHMESHNVLNISNVVHMFALHHTFIPRIERVLGEWSRSHNNHPVLTEGHRTPLSGNMWRSLRNIPTELDDGESNVNWDDINFQATMTL